MPKFNYAVRYGGKEIGRRRSDRIYTHAVIGLLDEEAERKTQRRYVTHVDRPAYSHYRREIDAGRAPEDKLGGAKTEDEYAARRLIERMIDVDRLKADGRFSKWLVLAYCGRADLAIKTRGSYWKSGLYKDIDIIEIRSS